MSSIAFGKYIIFVWGFIIVSIFVFKFYIACPQFFSNFIECCYNYSFRLFLENLSVPLYFLFLAIVCGKFIWSHILYSIIYNFCVLGLATVFSWLDVLAFYQKYKM